MVLRQGGLIEGEVPDQDIGVVVRLFAAETYLSRQQLGDELLAQPHALVEELVARARHSENVARLIARSDLLLDNVPDIIPVRSDRPVVQSLEGLLDVLDFQL